MPTPAILWRVLSRRVRSGLAETFVRRLPRLRGGRDWSRGGETGDLRGDAVSLAG